MLSSQFTKSRKTNRHYLKNIAKLAKWRQVSKRLEDESKRPESLIAMYAQEIEKADQTEPNDLARLEV